MKKTIFILLSIQFLFATSTQTIKSGEVIENSVKQKKKKFYTITVPKNRSLCVNLTKLKADVDLYVKRGNTVRVRFNNDCYSSNIHRENEECTITNKGETSIYTVLVYGFKDSSFRLKATIVGAEEIPTLTTNKAIEDEVAKKEGKQYQFPAKKGKPITITLSDLTEDADLRVKVGRKAGLHTFDCKSTKGGTKKEECVITPKKDDTVYVQVYGYKCAKYSLKATKGISQNNHKPSLKNSKIITLAKEHCLDKKNNTNTVLCSNQNNIAFVLNFENINEIEMEAKLYKVNISEGKESASIIKKYDNEGPQIRKGDIYFLKESQKLDHYYLIEHRYPAVYLTGNISLVNYSGKTLIRLPYYEAFKQKILSIKATGKYKLTVIESKKTPQDIKAKKIRKIYDISNQNKVKLISEENI